MSLDIMSPAYSRNASVLLNAIESDFTQASWNQDEQRIPYLPYCIGVAPKNFDPASTDVIPAPRELTQETSGTDLVKDYIKAYPDELEEDVVLPFPPVQKYSVDLTVTKITRWKLRLVATEDLL